MTATLFAFSLLFGLAFLHPYIFYPLSLKMRKAQPIAKGSDDRPSATLLFSAYNEERSLPAKLMNLEAIKSLHPELEIIAYSDACSDNSLPILQSRPDLLTVIPASERTGKAVGMRKMVEKAKGDICIYTDANVLLDPSSIAPLLNYFRNPEIGGVAGTLHYINDNDSSTALAGGLYWRLEERIKRLESRCGSIMGADGSIFATRRALYPIVPPHLLDDMTVSMSVIFSGLRLISAPDVIAFERNTTDSRDEFRRKRRIACRAFNTHRYLLPRIKTHFTPFARYQYRSHKLVRWLGAPLLLASIISLTAALILSGQALLAAAFWTLGGLALVGGLLGLPPLNTVTSILSSIVATFIGVTDAWRGRTYQTWSPAKSRD